MLAVHLGEQLLDIDVDLAGGPDVANLEAVGLEAVLHEPDLLDRDPVLARIVDLEAGRRRPDVAGVAPGKVAPLVHVTAGDEAQGDMCKHLDQPRAGRLRRIADRRLRRLGFVGPVEKYRLVYEQRDRLAVRARNFRSKPIELLGLEGEP